jgi:hypothetical protein
MGKTKDLSTFERGMVLGVRRNGWSAPRTATLFDFSLIVSRVHAPI